MEYLEIDDLIFVNQYVQNIVTVEEVNSWFESFEEIDQQLIVRTIWQLAVQARVNNNDVLNAMNVAKLKPTNTPVVILNSGKLTLWQRGGDLSKLKGKVLKQAFWLVLECFASADRRRKEAESKNGVECTHWWHRNLSDKKVVEQIRKSKV